MFSDTDVMYTDCYSPATADDDDDDVDDDDGDNDDGSMILTDIVQNHTIGKCQV